jgi:hypothetical protein
VPALVPSARVNYRSDYGVVKHSRFISFDFDHIPTTEMNAEFSRIKSIPSVWSAFKSPSQEGIKAIVKVDFPGIDRIHSTGTKEDGPTRSQLKLKQNHVETFNQWIKKYPSKYVDQKCKDVSRVMFLSYDPETYINDDCESFEMDPDIRTESSEISSPASQDGLSNDFELTENGTYKIPFANLSVTDQKIQVEIAQRILQKLPVSYINHYDSANNVCLSLYNFFGHDIAKKLFLEFDARKTRSDRSSTEAILKSGLKRNRYMTIEWLHKIANQHGISTEYVNPEDVMGNTADFDEISNQMDDIFNSPELRKKIQGVETGYDKLDKIFKWVHPSTTVWTAGSGVGKSTTFMALSVLRAATDDNFHVIMYSPENTASLSVWVSKISSILNMEPLLGYSQDYSDPEKFHRLKSKTIAFIKKHYTLLNPTGDDTMQNILERARIIAEKKRKENPSIEIALMIDPYNRVKVPEMSDKNIMRDQVTDMVLDHWQKFSHEHDFSSHLVMHQKHLQTTTEYASTGEKDADGTLIKVRKKRQSAVTAENIKEGLSASSIPDMIVAIQARDINDHKNTLTEISNKKSRFSDVTGIIPGAETILKYDLKTSRYINVNIDTENNDAPSYEGCTCPWGEAGLGTMLTPEEMQEHLSLAGRREEKLHEKKKEKIKKDQDYANFNPEGNQVPLGFGRLENSEEPDLPNPAEEFGHNNHIEEASSNFEEDDAPF